MAVPRSEIERALDNLISNVGGMAFQPLAVVLAKKRWPDLVACERKKDLGADAIAKAPFAAEGKGIVLACSTTATLAKVRLDAEKVKNQVNQRVRGTDIVENVIGELPPCRPSNNPYRLLRSSECVFIFDLISRSFRGLR